MNPLKRKRQIPSTPPSIPIMDELDKIINNKELTPEMKCFKIYRAIVNKDIPDSEIWEMLLKNKQNKKGWG